jgi:hypothetical protein
LKSIKGFLTAFSSTQAAAESNNDTTPCGIDDEEGPVSSREDDDNAILTELSNRNISNGCAICLDEYESGEKVIVSLDKNDCRHVYHHKCMRSFIKTKARKGIYDIPCPCCRQDFFNIQNWNEISQNNDGNSASSTVSVGENNQASSRRVSDSSSGSSLDPYSPEDDVLTMNA